MLRIGCQLNKIARRTKKQELLILRRIITKPSEIENVEQPPKNNFQYVLVLGCVVVIGGATYYIGNKNHLPILNSFGDNHKNFLNLMEKGESNLKQNDYTAVRLYL